MFLNFGTMTIFGTCLIGICFLGCGLSFGNSSTLERQKRAAPPTCCKQYGKSCTVGSTYCCFVGRMQLNYQCYYGATCDCRGGSQACTIPEDCCTGNCSGGYCTSKALLADICGSTLQCAAGLVCTIPSPNPMVAAQYPTNWGTCEYNPYNITYNDNLVCDSGGMCCPKTTTTSTTSTTTTSTTSSTTTTTTPTTTTTTTSTTTPTTTTTTPTTTTTTPTTTTTTPTTTTTTPTTTTTTTSTTTPTTTTTTPTTTTSTLFTSQQQCTCQLELKDCKERCVYKPRCYFSNQTCFCKDEWTGYDCSMLKFPSKVFGLIMLTAKTIDCTAVIVLLSVAIVGNILLRNFTPLISLGINTDLALLLAHILILTCRVPYIMNLTMTECKFVSIFCQYFMTVHFIFIFFESMQVYSIKTGLIGWGYPIPLQQQLILGWGLPLLSTGVNAAIKFNEYPLGWSCIVNYKTTVAVSIVLPMVMIAWATVVVFEASSADARTLKLLLSVSRTQFHAASVGLFTTAFYAAASCVSFVTVSLALFTIDEFVFSLGIILSTVTVATIVICRFLQNEKLAGYFSGLFKRLRNQDSKSISETDFATVQHIQPAIPSIKPYQNPPQTVQPTKKPVSFFVSAKIDDSSFSNKKTF